ncbi:VOC family protein [Nocardia brasiliensis]
MGSFSPRPATVGWFDITASDPAHAKQFYQEVFSWEFAPIGDDYHTITAPGAGAAMGALRRGDRDALWIDVVCTDLATTIPRLESLGAKVIEPADETPAGARSAVVADTRGNRLGLYEPANTGEADTTAAAAVPNATAWFEIGTLDFTVTRQFYEQAFGWTYERDEAAEGAVYYSISAPGAAEPIGGTMDLSALPDAAEYAIPGLLVADVSALLDRVERAGGHRVMDPFADAHGLVIAQFTDPFGNRWTSFAQPAAR